MKTFCKLLAVLAALSVTMLAIFVCLEKMQEKKAKYISLNNSYDKI